MEYIVSAHLLKFCFYGNGNIQVESLQTKRARSSRNPILKMKQVLSLNPFECDVVTTSSALPFSLVRRQHLHPSSRYRRVKHGERKERSAEATERSCFHRYSEAREAAALMEVSSGISRIAAAKYTAAKMLVHPSTFWSLELRTSILHFPFPPHPLYHLNSETKQACYYLHL